MYNRWLTETTRSSNLFIGSYDFGYEFNILNYNLNSSELIIFYKKNYISC